VPIVDVRITCLDGKHHPVDSSEMSFRAAGSLAFREAMSAARPVILEPISLVEVRVPSALQGDVLADLNARRGRILGTKAVSGSIQEISALVPSAEITRYAIDLRSLTGGRGWFVARHDHYSPMPPGMARPDQVSASSNHSR
jgi:elongation factor G